MHRLKIQVIGLSTAGVVASIALNGCVDGVDGCERTATCSANGGSRAGSPMSGAGGASSEGAEFAASGAGGHETAGDGGAGSSATGDAAGSEDGGAGGGAGNGDEAAPPPCTELSSDLEALCIDEQYGVFVSAKDGNDTTGDGTRARPYASIGRALAEAAKPDAPNRVYVCADAGDYEESVAVDAKRDGLELYGAFTCADWAVDAELKARITSRDQVAWHVVGLTHGLRVENVEILAADARGPGGSSFGMIVRDSENVLLRNVTVVAGNGADGAPGKAGRRGEDGATPGSGQLGTDAKCGVTEGEHAGGSWPEANACGSRGGDGGISGFAVPGGPGRTGAPTVNVSPADAGVGGNKGKNGTDGQAGAHGDPGANGVATSEMGWFIASGFVPAPRAGRGGEGFPGQGGGGGGGGDAPHKSTCIGASGGAGGMGGCGGKGGTGGSGGGASVALLSWNSSIILDGALLIAGAGGAGGKGGDGGPGGRGGPGARGGHGDTANDVGKGGAGGPGGNGGWGGGGAGGNGGPSYALVCQGAAPTQINGTTLVAGLAGPGGEGGAGIDAAAPSGYPGVAGELLLLP